MNLTADAAIRTLTQPMMNSVGARSIFAISPAELIDVLEAWALRREKVLPLLDPRAARGARALAAECRWLLEAGGPESPAWLEIRSSIGCFLATHSVPPRPGPLAPAFRPSCTMSRVAA